MFAYKHHTFGHQAILSSMIYNLISLLKKRIKDNVKQQRFILPLLYTFFIIVVATIVDLIPLTFVFTIGGSFLVAFFTIYVYTSPGEHVSVNLFHSTQLFATIMFKLLAFTKFNSFHVHPNCCLLYKITLPLRAYHKNKQTTLETLYLYRVLRDIW